MELKIKYYYYLQNELLQIYCLIIIINFLMPRNKYYVIGQ